MGHRSKLWSNMARQWNIDIVIQSFFAVAKTDLLGILPGYIMIHHDGTDLDLMGCFSHQVVKKHCHGFTLPWPFQGPEFSGTEVPTAYIRPIF